MLPNRALTRKRSNPTPSAEPKRGLPGAGKASSPLEEFPVRPRLLPAVRKPRPASPLAMRPGGRSKVVAHRGASGDYPELTLVAFENALAQGADGVECDIRMTLDGQLVCIHDGDTSRVSAEKRSVRITTMEELKRLDVGSWHLRHRCPEPPMALRELLELIEAYPEARAFIETKHPVIAGGRVERALAEELRYFGLDKPASFEESRAVMLSFSVLAVSRFGALAPQVPRLQLRHHRTGSKPMPAESYGIQVVGPSIDTIRAKPSLVEHWHRRGLAVYCWTVDDPFDVELCKALGVDWIGTNFPARTLAQVNEDEQLRAAEIGTGQGRAAQSASGHISR